MERSVTRFVGVSSSPEKTITEAAGLYEFFTDQDVHVYLHDTDYLGEDRPSPTDLRLYFVFDREWTPEAARETPVVKLAFADVRHRPHPTAQRQDLERKQPNRWVYSFDWDGMDGFTLDTSEIRHVFTSSRVTVSLLPSAPQHLPLNT